MIIDVASLIGDLDLGPIILETYPDPVQDAFGVWVEQAPTSTTVSPASWHTLDGADLEQVPEADRVSEVRVFYLRILPPVPGSVILCEGQRFRVIKSSDYRTSGGVSFVYAGRIDAPA